MGRVTGQMELLESRRPAPEAGWSLQRLWWGFGTAVLIYIGGAVLGQYVIQLLAWQRTPQIAIVLGAVQVAMVLPPLYIITRHGNPLQLLGLDRFDWMMVVEALTVLGLGFCGMLLWALVLLPFGIRAQDPIVPRFGEETLSLVAVFVIGALLAPVVEEILFRGFLFGGLRQHITPLRAAIISGALFGALHLQPFAFPPLFLLGVLLALLYHRTGSLWMPIVIHFVINSMAIVAQYFKLAAGEAFI